MQLLFVATVRPYLEFGNVAWSPRLEKDKKLVERVQRKVTNIIPGLKELAYEQIGENESTKHVLQNTERWSHRSVQVHLQCLQTQRQSA